MPTFGTTPPDLFRNRKEKTRALGVPVWSEADLDAALGGLA